MLIAKLFQIGYTPRGSVEAGSGGRVEAGEALLALVREVRVGGGEGAGLVEPGDLPWCERPADRAPDDRANRVILTIRADKVRGMG